MFINPQHCLLLQITQNKIYSYPIYVTPHPLTPIYSLTDLN